MDEFVADSSSDGSGEFDGEKWYVRSRNTKGFASTVRMNVPPSVTAEAGRIVASQRVSEFRTTADVYRHALVVGLKMTADRIDDPNFRKAVNSFTVSAAVETAIAHKESEEATNQMLSKSRYMGVDVNQFAELVNQVDDPKIAERMRQILGLD